MLDLVRVAHKPLMKPWARSRRQLLHEVPRPQPTGQLNIEGPDSDRILVVGAGLALGLGVDSHDDALAGCLGRSLSDLTGRGADIDVLTDPTMTVTSIGDYLDKVTLRRYDAVVLALGVNESLSLKSDRSWRRELSATIDTLLASIAPSARVFVLAVHSIRSIPIFNSRLGGLAEDQAAQLNAASAALCATNERAIFVPLSQRGGSDGGRGIRADYDAWAVELCDMMFDPLNLARAEAAHALGRNDFAEIERERQRGVDASGILDTDPEDRFDRIVDMARALYGTESAAFSVIDRDRQWHKSRSNVQPVEVSRVGSFCSITVQNRGPMLVLDAQTDSRVASSPQVTGDPKIRFYAGFPVESPTGARIGALCVFDPEPRDEADVDPAMLQQLAHLIQAELRVSPDFD